jgi:hypothetical protein
MAWFGCLEGCLLSLRHRLFGSLSCTYGYGNDLIKTKSKHALVSGLKMVAKVMVIFSPFSFLTSDGMALRNTYTSSEFSDACLAV